MNTQTPAIEFRNVSVSFGDHLVLNDVSFVLAQGELIFLTGISGSGKSVLVRVAMGLLKPDSGQILIEGTEIQDLSEEDLVDLRSGRLGMVFQEDSLFTGLTVYDNAAFRLAEHGWSEDDIKQAVAEVLSFVGLEGEENKFPEELSGGMKRRLEIARALIGWPRIMLFDEPTMSLDPLAALKVLNLVIRATEINHISSLYVSKKIHEIEYLASHLPNMKVFVLENGSILFKGSAAEFGQSDLSVIQELLTLDRHGHIEDPYFSDPWDKRRHPTETIL